MFKYTTCLPQYIMRHHQPFQLPINLSNYKNTQNHSGKSCKNHGENNIALELTKLNNSIENTAAYNNEAMYKTSVSWLPLLSVIVTWMM